MGEKKRSATSRSGSDIDETMPELLLVQSVAMATSAWRSLNLTSVSTSNA